ncbi:MULTISPECIES: flagellin [unclassified Cryobacterium]|uniref:flagellin N-terminal helical domain-containing protein n=1 Tax=unclassified Cryobacterium TaxID=2649013 RepID=UPI001069696A|nr:MULTISPECIES: flagellin [unclassified Cryobacterium]TFD03504.1 flagellin [Cryobacterium sp. TMT1-66-1]TFD12767.1 flagellin [Cryobacterium sp. TMT1-2-2]
MGMQVNTNVAANNAYRNLATTQNDLSKSLEKLSSGLRINRAADDAAGLAISEGLKSQVGGLTVAARNAQDAVSVIQTAEGSLNEVQSILQRVRDLAVQAGNDSNNTESRGAIQTEVTALTAELTRISESTNFNGTQLLDGSEAELSFQVGANGSASSQIKVNLAGADVTKVTDELTDGYRVTTEGSKPGPVASGNIQFDKATANGIYVISQGGTGAKSFTVDFGDTSAADLTDAQVFSKLDTAAKAANFADSSVPVDFVVSTNGTGTYSIQSKNTSLNDASANAITVTAGGSGATAGAGLAATTYSNSNTGTTDTSTFVDIAGLDFTDAAKAAKSIDLLDRQISNISTARASLGADQNRFESVIKNLAVSKENLTAAGSRIRDTDMAEEMVKYTRANILSQAGTAMLAQANQSNSGVLQLLQ